MNRLENQARVGAIDRNTPVNQEGSCNGSKSRPQKSGQHGRSIRRPPKDESEGMEQAHKATEYVIALKEPMTAAPMKTAMYPWGFIQVP